MSARIQVEVTDPTDGVTHVFEGSDDAAVDRQIDAFFAVDEAEQRERDSH
ncbi:MAG: hypothetical protein JST91_12955 [Actinobacteria bacterium]|nr:hypothetical protein [Actinomycetota bacterium]